MKKSHILCTAFLAFLLFLSFPAAVSAASLTYISPYTSLTYSVPSNVKALGIDVSAWQGAIDWQKVKADGIQFAIIRAAHHYGDTDINKDDINLTKNIEGAQAAGIKVGIYFYSQAITIAEVETEAQHVLDLISGYTIDLPIVMDVEFDNGHTGRLYDAHLSKRQMTDICLDYCNYMADRGYIPMIYCGTEILNNYLYPSELGNVAGLWYANYTPKDWPVGTPYSPLYTGTFAIWQYSSSGAVDGISGNVDCDFSFVDLDELGMPFNDVSQGKWYFNAVLYGYQHHLFSGITDDTFAPNAAMSRAMLVAVLYRQAGSPAVDGSSAFTDLSQSWYQNAVAWAYQNGIVSGTSATTFEPDTQITREQMVAILYRYSKVEGYDLTATNTLSGFSDGSSVSGYATTAVQWAVGEGYLSGNGNGTLCPKSSATRAEVASILQRFCVDH